MKHALLPFALLLLLTLHSCKEEPPTTPIDAPRSSLALSVADSSCTDIWLRLTYSDSSAYALKLYRDTTLIFDGIVYAPDTLYLDNLIISPISASLTVPLSPNTPYAYRAYRLENNRIVDSSNLVQTRTMDTTSHDFQWTTYELGEGTSYLRDVCMINDTCVWVVGQIYLRDSTGNIEYSRHNAAKWNGIRWEVVKLWFPLWTSNGNAPGPHEGMAVFGFSPNDIWFSDGGSYLHWNGTTFEPYYFPPDSELRGGVKMWGTSSQNLFSVSYNGAICHFDGVMWKRMPSGTTVHLTDIHGTPDGKEVWACGNNTEDGRSVLLRLNNGTWQTVWQNRNWFSFPLYTYLLGVCVKGAQVFSVGGGFFRHSLLNFSLLRKDTHDVIWFQRAGLTGSASNNLFTGGDFASLWHWNGFSWKNYPQLLDDDGRIRSLSASESEVFAVGLKYTSWMSKGLVYHGRRPAP